MATKTHHNVSWSRVRDLDSSPSTDSDLLCDLKETLLLSMLQLKGKRVGLIQICVSLSILNIYLNLLENRIPWPNKVGNLGLLHSPIRDT